MQYDISGESSGVLGGLDVKGMLKTVNAFIQPFIALMIVIILCLVIYLVHTIRKHVSVKVDVDASIPENTTTAGESFSPNPTDFANLVSLPMSGSEAMAAGRVYEKDLQDYLLRN